MQKINFFSRNKGDGLGTLEFQLTPLRYNKKKLYERGYDINVVYDLFDKKNYECDILCLLSKAILPNFKNSKYVENEESNLIKYLIDLKKGANKIVWFDTSDSTSVTHFELMPYIDLYLKRQIYVDKNNYNNNYYGGRIFSDYYHKNYNVADDKIFK